jgi:CheY-like chemotaxis protein
MLANSTPVYLLASHDPKLLEAFEPLLASGGAQVEIFLSAEAALSALAAAHAPALALIDVNLPGMEMGRFLASARA